MIDEENRPTDPDELPEIEPISDREKLINTFEFIIGFALVYVVFAYGGEVIDWILK